MNSLVKDEHLSEKNRVRGTGYDTGLLTPKAQKEIQGYSLKSGQLMGRFDGVRTFLAFVNSDIEYGWRKPKTSTSRYSDDSSHSEARGSSWVTYDTYEQAMKVMLDKPQLFRDFTESDLRLKDYEQPTGFETDYGMTGDFLDIGRVVEGQPESFGTMRNGNVVNKFASIVVLGMSSAGVSATEIQKRANQTLRLVDMLEANNVRCKVTVLYSNDNWHCEIIAKQYKDVLDIDDLAVATSADFFRRAQFYYAEHSQTKSDSYGSPTSLRVETVKDEDADITILIGNRYAQGAEFGTGGNWTIQFEQLEKHLLDNGIQGGDVADLLNNGLVYNGLQIREE